MKNPVELLPRMQHCWGLAIEVIHFKVDFISKSIFKTFHSHFHRMLAPMKFPNLLTAFRMWIAESSVQSVLHQNIRIQRDHPRVAKVRIRSHQQCPWRFGGIRKPPWTRQGFSGNLKPWKHVPPDCHGTRHSQVHGFAFFAWGLLLWGTVFHVFSRISSVHFPPNLYIRRIQESQFGLFPTFQGLPLQKMAVRKEKPITSYSSRIEHSMVISQNLKTPWKSWQNCTALRAK